MLRRFPQALFTERHRSDFAREPDFSKGHQVDWQRPVAQARQHGENGRQIRRRLTDTHTADEIFDIAMQGRGAVIRGWGATHLLRDVPHAVCVRVCAPFEVRKRRMMERLASEDEEVIAEEIRNNDEAHAAIVRRHFDLRWTDPENYDVVLNTKRVRVDECVEEVLSLVRAPQFAETEGTRRTLDDLALAARVRAALRRAPETREARVTVNADGGRVALSGAGSTDEMLAFVEVASTVPGVRDVAYRTLQ